jgi:multiple sugar transport system substrate-binding protein
MLRAMGLTTAALVVAACSPSGASNTNAAPTTAAASGGGAAVAPTTAAGAGAAPAVSSKGGALAVAIPGTQTDPLMQQQAQQFMSANGNVKITFTALPGDWPQIFSKLLTMIAAGNPPDLALVATEGLELFAGQGLSLSLDDYVKRDQAQMQEYFSDVHPALVEAMMYKGSLYELPNDFNAANMFYNTGLFKAAGIDRPADDWDLNTFTDIASKLTKKSGSTVSSYGFGWVNRVWGSWTSFIMANNTNLLTAERYPGGSWLWDAFYKNDSAAKGWAGGWNYTGAQANNPAVVEALQECLDLRDKGFSMQPDEGDGGLLQGFFTGNKLGMTIAGGFWAGGLNQAGMKPDAYDVLFFPKWKVQTMEFGTAGLAMLKGAKDKDLAWEYMKYFNSKPAMDLRFKGNSTTPCRRSMMTAARYQSTGPAHWQVFYDTLDKYPSTVPIPAPTKYHEISTTFLKYTSLAMTGQQTAQAALDGMQKELEPLFKA